MDMEGHGSIIKAQMIYIVLPVSIFATGCWMTIFLFLYNFLKNNVQNNNDLQSFGVFIGWTSQ